MLFLHLHCRYSDYWFYIPIIGPHIGAILGAITYTLAIENHWDDSEEICKEPCQELPIVNCLESEVNGRQKKISKISC